jgi:Icc-related predicted phosphoesterase
LEGNEVIIDCIADLHGYYPELEGGDLLIVAGDLTADESSADQLECLSWIQNSKYKKKILIAGNHDNWMRKLKHDHFKEWGFTCLCDSGTEFEGLKIWGSPWTPLFEGVKPRCTAFMLPEEELDAKFALIPDDTDILVTHGPPYGTLDLVKQINFTEETYFSGSKSLAKRLEYIQPFIHVFGHIHECYGSIRKPIMNLKKTKMCNFVNASHVNEYYQPVNKPIRIEL